MNSNEENWVINTVSDYIIDTQDEKTGKKYYFLAYTNTSNNLVVIRFQINSEPFDHIVLDYNSKIIREDCYGINVFDTFVRLNCDLLELQEIGKYINYTLDEEFTNKLNSILAPEQNE